MSPYETSVALGDNGRRYLVELFRDDCSSAPWENEDGHGPVRRAERDPLTGHVRKRPGEVVLKDGGRREDSCVYDFPAAMKRAKAQRWDAAPHGEPGAALRAVKADMAHLKDWLAGGWWYVGVAVTPLTDDGDELRSKSASVWGDRVDRRGLHRPGGGRAGRGTGAEFEEEGTS